MFIQLFKKNPRDRTTLAQLRLQHWLAAFDLPPIITEEQNASVDIEVTQEDVSQSLTEIVPMDTLVCREHDT